MLRRYVSPAMAGKCLLAGALLWSAGVSLHAKSPTETSSGLHSRARNVGTNSIRASVKKSKGTPHEINYQGWLGDTTDTTGITGNLAMTFRLYGAETVGTELWSEAHISVPVDKGIFNVILGSVNPILSNVFTGDPLWLEIQAATDTLSPRKKLVSVGYAIKSENADNAIYADTAGYANSSAPDNDWTVSGSNLYAQNTSWNVGIGTTSPPTDARLYVDANGADYGVFGTGSTGKQAGMYGEANGAWYGVLGQGSTGKTAGVYGWATGANYGVQGTGSTGKQAGVYGTANGAEYGVRGDGSSGKTAGVFGSAGGADYAGYFDGDVHIEGEVTIDTVVRYYSIPPCEFGAANYTTSYWHRRSYLFTTGSGSSDWNAGVNLPDGAIVTSIDGYVHDTDASKDMDLRLYRRPHFVGATIMAEVSSSGSGGEQTITDNSIEDATINNGSYAYYVEVRLTAGSDAHRVYEVRITYEITQPLP